MYTYLHVYINIYIHIYIYLHAYIYVSITDGKKTDDSRYLDDHGIGYDRDIRILADGKKNDEKSIIQASGKHMNTYIYIHVCIYIYMYIYMYI
jgi:hypothetical protein